MQPKKIKKQTFLFYTISSLVSLFHKPLSSSSAPPFYGVTMASIQQQASGPYFANQRSNLSSLAASLSNYSTELGKDATTIRTNLMTPVSFDTVDKANTILSTCSTFLAKQEKRVEAVEEQLLDATELILPIENGENSMTVNELSLQHIDLQKDYVQEMMRLEEKLHKYGFVGSHHKQWDASFAKNLNPKRQNPSPSSSGATPWQQFVGQPLEQVIEAEYETDATTTPASPTAEFFRSPKSTSSASSDPSTPETPSLDKLHLSDSTANVIKNSVHDVPGAVTTKNYSTAQTDEDALDREVRLSLDAIERWRKQGRRQSQDTSLDSSRLSNQSPTNNTAQSLIGTLFRGKFDNRSTASTTCDLIKLNNTVDEQKRSSQSYLPIRLTSDVSKQEKQKIEGEQGESGTDLRSRLTFKIPTGEIEGNKSQPEDQTSCTSKDLLCAEFSESDEEMTLDLTHDDGVSLVTTATLVGRGRTRKQQHPSIAGSSIISESAENQSEDAHSNIPSNTKAKLEYRNRKGSSNSPSKSMSLESTHGREQSLKKTREGRPIEAKENNKDNDNARSSSSSPKLTSVNSSQRLHSAERSLSETHDTLSTITRKTLIECGRLKKNIHVNRNGHKNLAQTNGDAVEMQTNIQTRQSPPLSISRSKDHHMVEDVYVDENTNMSPMSMATANHTVDVTMLDETFPPPSPPKDSKVKENDEILTITPVLDRYRLEADDSSIGVKVVPNLRGIHHTRSTKASEYHSRVNATKSEPHTLSNYDRGSSIKSHVNTSKNAMVERSTRQRAPLATLNVNLTTPNKAEVKNKFTKINDAKKVYRKTPHSKKVGGLLPIDEHDSSRFSNQNQSDLNLGSPLLPPPPGSGSEKQSYNTNIVSRTPLTAAWLAKHIPKEKDLLSVVSAGGENPSVLSSFSRELQGSFEFHSSSHFQEKVGTSIRKLSQEEYDEAPRVVKMQVALNEVNRAAELLGVGFQDHQCVVGADPTKPKEISEIEAYSLLSREFPERKSRSVLMSLCHWRRMVMLQSSDNCGKSFILCS